MIWNGWLSWDIGDQDISVNWTCEETWLGDGQRELDWDIRAEDSCGKSWPLNQEQETQIIEYLKDQGEVQ